MKNYKETPLLPFVLITSLFLFWGLANNMTDTLLAAFKRIMNMNDFQTSWIQIAFYGSYFCLALPAAIIIKKFSYKRGVLLGLGLFIIGSMLFYPASKTMVYGHFLAALFILAGGLSILETSANPYIIAMGPPETGTRRLNLAQSFNPIGSILGVLLSKIFILSQLNGATLEERGLMDKQALTDIQSVELSAVMGPYVGVAFLLLVLWITIAVVKMPKASDEDDQLNFLPTIRRLLTNKNYKLAVIAQFFYVGAQIGIWSFTIRYVMLELHVNEDEASTFYIIALVLFMVSRFICTALMKFVEPARILVWLAFIAAICTLTVIVGGGYTGVYALVLISGCMSLMFPTIYGLGLEGLGKDTKIGGSGLIMAILGGAVLTALQGTISDAFDSIHIAFAIPLVCFILIMFYGLWTQKKKKSNEIAQSF